MKIKINTNFILWTPFQLQLVDSFFLLIVLVVYFKNRIFNLFTFHQNFNIREQCVVSSSSLSSTAAATQQQQQQEQQEQQR